MAVRFLPGYELQKLFRYHYRTENLISMLESQLSCLPQQNIYTCSYVVTYCYYMGAHPVTIAYMYQLIINHAFSFTSVHDIVIMLSCH